MRASRTARGVALAASLTLGATPPAPVLAASGGSDALNVCAAERAPMLVLEKQYDAVERSRMFASVQAGVVGGATAWLSTFHLGGVLNNVPGLHGGGAGPMGDLMKSMGGSNILGAAGNRVGTADGGQDKTLLIVMAALGSSVTTYLSLKAADAANDRRALAMAIDEDAGNQLSLGRTISGQARALTACRTQQVNDFKQRLAAASEPDRRKMKHEGEQIADAVRKDIALTDKVVGHQKDLAKTFTQARAMAEGHSEADVLANQKPAYEAAASTTAMQMPAKMPAATTPQAPPPPPPPPPPQIMLTMLRSTMVRDAPQPKGKVVLTLPARRQVKAHGMAAVGGWWEIDVAGSPGYLLESSVSVSIVQGLAASQPQTPTGPPPPSNVREYNKVVLEARDEGTGSYADVVDELPVKLKPEAINGHIQTRKLSVAP